MPFDLIESAAAADEVRQRLVSTAGIPGGVKLIDRPAPNDPAAVVFVIAGIRCYEVRIADGAFSAAFHIRSGEWLPLADGASYRAALAAVASHVDRIGRLPAVYSPATDAAERAAALAVHMENRAQ